VGLNVVERHIKECKEYLMFTDEKPYWWNIKSEYIKIEKLVLKAKNGMINGGREWVNDVKEDPVAVFTKGNYTMVGNVSCLYIKATQGNLKM
jgi:hypothetical protein